VERVCQKQDESEGHKKALALGHTPTSPPFQVTSDLDVSVVKENFVSYFFFSERNNFSKPRKVQCEDIALLFEMTHLGCYLKFFRLSV
jgi:hypothetical protein